MAAQYSFDRSRLIYELVVRQEPKQARMCGVGGKADRRPIDPPPIVQLRVIHPSVPGNSVAGSSKPRRDNSAGSDSASPDPSSFADGVADDSTYSQSYLQNPYYFMFACLARPDDETELHWLKDGRTRCTTGSVVSSLYHLKDPQNNNEDAGFFVFPDLSVRTEGSYRLKLSLFEVVENNVHHCKSIYSAPFYVYTAKKFPGMEESTPLSCSLADQGIKIRIRKDIRVRKRQIPALSQPLSTDVDGLDSDGDEEDAPDRRPKRQKRSRNDTFADAGGSGLSGVGAVQQQLPWSSTASINPSLGANIPPSTAPPNSMPSSSSGGVISAPSKPGKELQPANGMVMSVHLPSGGSLPGPSVFDGRGGGIIQMDPPSQPAMLNQQKSPQINNSSSQYRDSSQVDGAASSSPQLSPSSQPSHTQYPTPPSPVETAQPPPPQQQTLQPQHQPSHSLQNANGPPPQVAPHPSNHGPPPAMQHQPQPQHPQHMQHPQAGTYVSSPYPQWGPSAPMSAPAQPTVYDPYYHHQQHTHYPTYAPPPQQPLPPPPPARYDYGTGMYTHSPAPPPPPPAMPGYGYYDQHQQHHQPPHPQQQMIPHPHPYPQHQVHAPPPMPQYAHPPPTPAPTNNTPGGTPASMVADGAQIGNGANGSTPTQPPPNFASGSGVAAASVQTPVTQYDYNVVYNNRPPESATSRGGYGAPTPPQAPQYNMTPMHPAPMPAPAPPHHAAHPQAYAMHSAGAPHHPTPMRHSSYGPPPHPHAPHPHPAYSYATYAAPPPPAQEWAGQGFVTNHQHGWDAYAHHPQHPQQQGHLPVGQPQSHTPGGAPSGAMVNPGGVDQGHRIQLAPIPTENNPNVGNSANNGSPHSPVRSSNSSPPSMRTNGRVAMSNSVGERVDDGVHGYRTQGQGKKNPLSIGSIISNDAR